MNTNVELHSPTGVAANVPARIAAGLWLAASVCAGCASGPTPPRSLYLRLQNEDPTVRAEAIAEAARTRDEKALPYLVDRLGDSESDVRLFADAALGEMAGPAWKAMGWRSYDPPDVRAQAQQRWRDWLRRRAAGGAAPASSPAATGSKTETPEPSSGLKSETRNPKSETNPNDAKSKDPNATPGSSRLDHSNIRAWNLVSDFGFRISDSLRRERANLIRDGAPAVSRPAAAGRPAQRTLWS